MRITALILLSGLYLLLAHAHKVKKAECAILQRQKDSVQVLLDRCRAAENCALFYLKCKQTSKTP